MPVMGARNTVRDEGEWGEHAARMNKSGLLHRDESNQRCVPEVGKL
jgi:hypothetical protein